jgi:excisionase family DNA binding protein
VTTTEAPGAVDNLLPDPEQQPTIAVWPDAARALGLSRSAIYDAVARGELPVVRIGRRIRVVTAGLRRILELDGR